MNWLWPTSITSRGRPWILSWWNPSARRWPTTTMTGSSHSVTGPWRSYSCWKKQHGETAKKCDHAVKDAEYHRQSCRLTKEKNEEYKNQILRLKSECNQVIVEKDRLEKDVCELQKQLDDDKREMDQLRKQQKEAMSESGSSADHNFSVLYDTYVNRYEAVKQEYNNLKKNYSEALASLNTANSRADLMKEEHARLRKDYETIEKEHQSTVTECKRQKTHITAALQNSYQEKNELMKELQNAKLERDEYKRQIGQAAADKIKTTKEYGQLKKERDAVVHEYTLIMSERDTVHKEIEQLQDKLTGLQKKYDRLENENKMAVKEIETQRGEMDSAHQEREHAIKQYNDMKDRLGDCFPDVMEIDRHRDNLMKEIDKMRSELELQRDTKRGVNAFERSMKDITDSKESENLRKEVERLQAELTGKNWLTSPLTTSIRYPALSSTRVLCQFQIKVIKTYHCRQAWKVRFIVCPDGIVDCFRAACNRRTNGLSLILVYGRRWRGLITWPSRAIYAPTMCHYRQKDATTCLVVIVDDPAPVVTTHAKTKSTHCTKQCCSPGWRLWGLLKHRRSTHTESAQWCRWIWSGRVFLHQATR